MDNKKLKQFIEKVLKSDDRLWDEDKTDLNETLLIDLVEKIDEKIIGLLLNEQSLREKFFVKIKDVYVFKTNNFRYFIEENKIDNSYTQYKNRIGLTDGKRFLKDTNEVVLDFPYKDCVLEGGQSTEEGTDTYFEYKEETLKDKLDENGNKIKDGRKNVKEVDEVGHYEQKLAKRKEIFFNSVLAHDEIDRLFDEKALVNWKRYTKDGGQEVKEIKRDEYGTIKENLIIKGNNLLALHGLKKEFTGNVKLIYIDPPYNTGNDGFKYNDNFNHSTWLTFMKNRLEVAKELLSDEGIIFVQCDDNEQAYLKVLMDDIFKNGFISTISIKSSTASGVKISHATKKILKETDFLLSYKKDLIDIKPQYIRKNKWDTHYMFFIENNKLLNLQDILIKNNLLNKKQTIKDFDINNKKHREFYLKNGNFIVRKSTHSNKEIKKICNGEFKDEIYSNNGYYYLNNDMLQSISKSFQKVFNGQSIETDISNLLCDFWHDIDFQNTQNQGGISFPAGKKPEQLIYRIIEMATNKNDIVFDYHLGSGTTCAVAHKMGIQYIGIEQMDYIEDIAVERMKKVIDGEQGGISKAVNWQGGGDFIYFELAKWNEKAKEEILKKKSLDELIKFFDEMYEKYFLNYNLKIKEFKKKVIHEEEFKNLSLEEQKKMFMAMLDNNQMYVNKTEMEDKKFGIDKKDIELTKNFYNGEK